MTTGAHFGDPCIYCHTPHDDVPTGQCEGHGVLISRDRAEALLEYAKTGRGPSGWPTTLWAEVQRFIEGIEAQLLSPKTDSLPSPIAWRYRWKIEGEWTNWRVAEASQASRHLPSLEEHPLYAPPVPAQDDDKLRIMRADDVPVWSDGIVTDGERVAMAQKAEADYGGTYWSVETGDGALEWEPTHFIDLAALKSTAAHEGDPA